MIKKLKWVDAGTSQIRAEGIQGSWYLVSAYLTEYATFESCRAIFYSGNCSAFDRVIYDGVSREEAKTACEELHQEHVKNLLAEYLDFSALESMLQRETLTAKEILETLK